MCICFKQHTRPFQNEIGFNFDFFFSFFFQFFLFLFFILNKKGVLVVFICFQKVFVIGISSVDDLICMEVPGMLYMVFIKLFASYT